MLRGQCCFERRLLRLLELLRFACQAGLFGDVRRGRRNDQPNLERKREPGIDTRGRALDERENSSARNSGRDDEKSERSREAQPLKGSTKNPEHSERSPHADVDRERLDVQLSVLHARKAHPIGHHRAGEETQRRPPNRANAKKEKNVARHADKIAPFAFQRKLVQSLVVPKVRADVLLTQRGLAHSRSRAQALILAGKVFTGGRRVEKSGEHLDADAPIEVREPDHPFVSRGGVKLAGALAAFGYDPSEAVVADFGASTGGFTDCLLQHGAAKVFAIDVGYGQLHNKLRQDERVVAMERTNARHL